jgi:hypothetical protein
MPRRPPARVRASHPRPTSIPGVPIATSRAIDRLDRSGISSATVGEALATWRAVVRLPRSALHGDNNDWTGFIGPIARTVLEDAILALRSRQRAPLRREVARLDAWYAQKTLNDPRKDQSSPWWSRRC